MNATCRHRKTQGRHAERVQQQQLAIARMLVMEPRLLISEMKAARIVEISAEARKMFLFGKVEALR